MSETRHILVVDDDPSIRRLLRRCFEQEGYRVSEAANGREIDAAPLEELSLITLDLGLGSEDGLQIARAIRSRSDVPIIMLTGKGEMIDRVVGLELGADDYIAKPFHVREVLARVRTVLRRLEPPSRAPAAQPEPSNCCRFDDWEADFDRLELRRGDGTPVELTSGEMRLLQVFTQHAGRVLSREQLMDLLKGQDWSPYDRSIDNQIARLRKKIEADPRHPQIVKTVHGAGYKFSARVRRGEGAK